MSSVRLISLLLLTLALSSSIQPTFTFRQPPKALSDIQLSKGRSSSSSSSSASCWDAINEVEGCQDEIFMSSKSNEIEVGYECCKVILQRLPPNCAEDVMSSGGEFSAEFGSAVNEYCDGMGITPPLVDAEVEAV